MATFTARQTHAHRSRGPRGVMVHQFSVDVKCDWQKIDACKIGSANFYAEFRSHKPGWVVVSKAQKPIQRLQVPKPDCLSSLGTPNMMDMVISGYDYVLEYRLLSIPTPWGSIGGITLARVELSISLIITPDGAVKKIVH